MLRAMLKRVGRTLQQSGFRAAEAVRVAASSTVGETGTLRMVRTAPELMTVQIPEKGRTPEMPEEEEVEVEQAAGLAARDLMRDMARLTGHGRRFAFIGAFKMEAVPGPKGRELMLAASGTTKQAVAEQLPDEREGWKAPPMVLVLTKTSSQSQRAMSAAFEPVMQTVAEMMLMAVSKEGAEKLKGEARR